ncbi:predicted protein [Thalassiosira pseudonana CCMP1335]|uniref:Kinesin light chain n=1 Tax=Thalassiosira pseudonana TaxID=35128 RepID=B8CBA5_THAPS|nr:predicted protein [Thalassiosira pseudonana CCMP1335]EED89285.1 predicted protein [Thalassiosira pseudonana CCMP1335]
MPLRKKSSTRTTTATASLSSREDAPPKESKFFQIGKGNSYNKPKTAAAAKSASSSSTSAAAVTSSTTRAPLPKRFSTTRKAPSYRINTSVSFKHDRQDLKFDDPDATLTALAEEDETEQDPLLQLFRVHNTNRVKFDLEDKRGKSQQQQQQSVEKNGKEKKDSSGGTFNIKKFVTSSIFGNPIASKSGEGRGHYQLYSHNSQSTQSILQLKDDTLLNMEDPEDAIIKKMLTPPPARRISSFLNSVRGSVGGSSEEKNSQHKSFSGDSASAAERTRSFSTIDGGVNSEMSTNVSATTTTMGRKPSKASKEIIARLLKKAQRAHRKTFRYRLAMKYYLMALKEMNTAGYSDSDPLMIKVLKSLNDVHHAQSTLSNSANIVTMGIQHEDKNQHVKALKMYTIAYRMRRDSLGVDHPSLPVLLNMMGSVQVKRGEYTEAMQIYELGLKGRADENGGNGRKRNKFRNQNPLTTSVTLRDMGMILEHMGSEDKALKFYHASLRYAVKYKESCEASSGNKSKGDGDSEEDGIVRERLASDDVSEDRSQMTKDSINEKDSTTDPWLENMDGHVDEPFSLEEVRMVKSTSVEDKLAGATIKGSLVDTDESGEMELFLEKRFDRCLSPGTPKSSDATKFYYDELFVSAPPSGNWAEGESPDVDLAMTLHQIGQIHRRSHRYAAALSAYNASLRGMKLVFGEEHAHIAAILGNIGNLYMETGDNDEAFEVYQEVLGIETLHLGLSHPEVAVTLHNIATIECSRGQYGEGVKIYKQVVEMQKIRYGHKHITVAITLSCLADAYEKLGNTNGAIKIYEEALKIRIGVLGKAHLDVGRLMHKLGRLASCRKDYRVANIYMARAEEIYTLNKLATDHTFLLEMARDKADIQAGLAFGYV